METVIIALSALIASGLTLFSGFGLGTLLMPVVAIFFPVNIAIGITAVVHFANNIFKLSLIGSRADRQTVVRFGLPAIAASFIGAALLVWMKSLPPLFTYTLLGKTIEVVPIQVIVGIMIFIFVVLELTPSFSSITFERKYLPFGGAISGFFGGLSGHQGAFRSMFLIKAGLNKEQFIATGIVLAVMIDISRLFVYGWDAVSSRQNIEWRLVVIATLSAFIGAAIGVRLMEKLTFRSIRLIVSGLLIVVALGLIMGIL